MFTREQITEILRREYSYITSAYGLKRIDIFGSYAKGVPHEHSDIDLVAEFNAPIGLKFVAFSDYLEHLFEASVDALTPAGIQVIRNTKIVKNIQETIIYVQYRS